MQHLIVGLLVAAALLYSVWALMPAGVRRAAATRLASLAQRSGMGAPKAQRLQAKLETAGACSECAQCKGCAVGRKPGPGPGA